ncbi:MAG: biotin-dependent carboxyltransferase [Syntrophorhabdales bacterium]|nr:biotin-dependent carboxyltransferase [Syntrophorhabdales bacterium]
MIEVLNPGFQAIIVDKGRFGFGDIGVPTSSALDSLAYKTANYLTGNPEDAPVIESIGPMLSLRFQYPVVFAITGAWVEGLLDEIPFTSWQSLRADKGSIMKIKGVKEGLRYYIGFSGLIDIETVMGSFTTNMECHFGGYEGRQLKKGDLLRLRDIKDTSESSIDKDMIPTMGSPHPLRVIDGPEAGFFNNDPIERFFKESYKVSPKSNRTGIRLTGMPLEFKEGVEKSIISEGILPGTIQIPGDGMPVIMLYERTVGGYARLAIVIKADHDRLAHLTPGDDVIFKKVSIEEAEEIWMEKQKNNKKFIKNVIDNVYNVSTVKNLRK